MGLDGILKKSLHRALCPAPHDLGEFQMGLLPAEQAEAIKSHLTECPRCRAELAILERYLNDLKPDVSYSLEERVKIWFARLLPQPGLQRAFAVRGEESSSLLRYSFGEGEASGELTIEVQEDPMHPGRRVVLGLIIGMVGEDVQAVLWKHGQVAAEISVDPIGNMALDNLLPGEYDLVIRGGNVEVYVQNLKV